MSLTDSPRRNYNSNSNSHAQAYPIDVPRANYVFIDFNQVCIVRQLDSALVEYSYDTGATWQIAAYFDETEDDRWADRSADPGDWASARAVVPSEEDGGMVLIRFRLAANPVGTADGWYIDDLNVHTVPLAVGDGEDRTGNLTSQIVPNPFSDEAMVRFTLPGRSRVRIVVFDRLGREVAVIAQGSFEQGGHGIGFDASDIASGIYFYSVETEFGSSRGSFVVAREEVTIVHPTRHA